MLSRSLGIIGFVHFAYGKNLYPDFLVACTATIMCWVMTGWDEVRWSLVVLCLSSICLESAPHHLIFITAHHDTALEDHRIIVGWAQHRRHEVIYPHARIRVIRQKNAVLIYSTVLYHITRERHTLAYVVVHSLISIHLHKRDRVHRSSNFKADIKFSYCTRSYTLPTLNLKPSPSRATKEP